jgi:hypothetical protein
MDQYDALILVAELALGISGFSGVVVALGTSLGDWPEVDRLRLAALLAAGIGALFLVLIALLLIMLDVDGDRVWRISSILMSAHGLGVMFTIVPRAWAITRDTSGMKSPYSVAVFIPVVFMLCINIVVQLVNATGILNRDPFGIFFAGLVILLLISGVQFLRLLFVKRDTEL